MPICLYEELWLNSPSGLNEVLQFSRTGIGEQLDAALQSLADMVAKAAAIPAQASRNVESSGLASNFPGRGGTVGTGAQRGDESSSAEAQGADRLFRVLLDVLCCLIVADGRVSKSEKKCIHDLMTNLHSPWSDSEVDERIAAFIDRVQTNGYRKTLAVALKDVEVFKQVGKQEVLLRCLDAVAKADDKVTDREFQLCQRIKAIVE